MSLSRGTSYFEREALHGLARRVHVRLGPGDDDRTVPDLDTPGERAAVEPVETRRTAGGLPGECLHDVEADVVARSGIPVAGVAESHHEEEVVRAYFFSFFSALPSGFAGTAAFPAAAGSAPSSSFLPFLITSGSAAAATAPSTPTTSAAAGAATSSAFGTPTCTITRSAVLEDLDLVAELEVRDAQRVVHLHGGDVHLHGLGDVGGKTLDEDLVRDDVQDAARVLDAVRNALDRDLALDAELPVEENAHEVDVQHLPRDGVEREVANHDVARLVRALQIELEDRVGVQALVEKGREGLARHLERPGLHVLAAPVEDGGDLVLRAQPVRGVLPGGEPLLDFDDDVFLEHGFLSGRPVPRGFPGADGPVEQGM